MELNREKLLLHELVICLYMNRNYVSEGIKSYLDYT